MPGPVNTNQQVNVAESADPVGSAFLSRAQVRALATPAADVRRAPGVAWASAWVRRRPQRVAAEQGAAVVPPVVAAAQRVATLPVVAFQRR